MDQSPEKNDPLIELLGHSDWLQDLARTLVTSDSDADDLVQQTWLAASECPPRDISRPRAWLTSVMKRSFWKQSNSRKKQQELAIREAKETGSDSSLERLEMHRDLTEALMMLAEKQRQVIVLKYFDGLSRAEIALKLGIPEETVKTRLRRGVEKLREDLRRKFGHAGDWRLAVAAGMGMHEFLPEKIVATTTVSTGLISGGILMSVSAKIIVPAVVVIIAIATWSQFAEVDESLSPNDVETTIQTQREASRHVPKKAITPANNLAKEALTDPKSSEVAKVTVPEGQTTSVTVQGIVLNAQEQPVVGAAVYWRTESKGYPIRSMSEFSRQVGLNELARTRVISPRKSVMSFDQEITRTTESGHFELQVSTDDKTLELGAYDERFGYQVAIGLAISEMSTSTPIRLKLIPAVVFEGHVRDTNGRPIAGARVDFSGGKKTTNEDGSVSSTLSAIGERTTDKDGFYRSWSLPFSFFRVSSSRKGYRQDSAIAYSDPNKRVIQLDFELEKSQWHRGLFVDDEGRQVDLLAAIDRVRKNRSRQEYLEEHRLIVWSGWGQRYQSSPMNKADLRLNLENAYYERNPTSKDEWVTLYAGNVILGKAKITADLQAPDIQVDLSKLPAPDPRVDVPIRVSTEGAQPINAFRAKWTIFVRGMKRVETSKWYESKGKSGRLTITEVPCRLSSLEIEAKGYSSQSMLMHPKTGQETVEVQLRKCAGSIRGKVIGLDGLPIQGSFVFAIPRVNSGWGIPSGKPQRIADFGGHFFIDGLAAGEYLVLVDAEEMIIPSQVVTVTQGEAACQLKELPSVKVGLTPSISNQPLQFKIIDHAGRVVRDDELRGRAITGGGPSLRLPPGRYSFEVTSSQLKKYVGEFDAQKDLDVQFELTPRD